jgi:hypothetical protein
MTAREATRQHGTGGAGGVAPASPRLAQQDGTLPYDDPHLAWLVSTYLTTPEGQAIRAQHTQSADQGIEPAAAIADDVETGQFETFDDVDPRAEIELPPNTDMRRRNIIRTAIMLASTVAIMACISLLAVVLLQQEPEAVADGRVAPSQARTFAINVECPFMGEPVTVGITAPHIQDAIDEAGRALTQCTVMPGDFDARSNRR